MTQAHLFLSRVRWSLRNWSRYQRGNLFVRCSSKVRKTNVKIYSLRDNVYRGQVNSPYFEERDCVEGEHPVFEFGYESSGSYNQGLTGTGLSSIPSPRYDHLHLSLLISDCRGDSLGNYFFFTERLISNNKKEWGRDHVNTSLSRIFFSVSLDVEMTSL